MMQGDNLPLIVEDRRPGGSGLGIDQVVHEPLADLLADGTRRQVHDPARTDGDLLRPTVGMLDDRHPFAAQTLARGRQELEPAKAFDRDATIRQGRDRDKRDIERRVREEELVRLEVELHRPFEHAIEIMLEPELRFCLAGLILAAKNVVVGDQQPWPDQKSGAVPFGSLGGGANPAYRFGRASPAIEVVDRRQVALTKDAFMPGRVGLARLDQRLSKCAPALDVLTHA